MGPRKAMTNWRGVRAVISCFRLFHHLERNFSAYFRFRMPPFHDRKEFSAYFFSADLRFEAEVASIFFSYKIQPFERQAHRRFSSRSRYGGMQLRIRMSLRFLHALLQNHFSTLLLSYFLTLH